MLSPASSRDETITSDATSFDDDGLNSPGPGQAISTTTKTQPSSTALVDIPDDESEASLMVLMRYMGCTPVPYGSGPQRSTSDVDDHSLLSDQYTYDNDLHSKDTFDTIEPHDIDGIKKSWTLDNDEVGVELDLDTLVINDVKDRLRKYNNNNLSVNTNDDTDVPSDEQKEGSVTSPEGTTTTEEEGSRDVKFGAMLSVDEKLEKEKNENDDGLGLTSFNNYLEKKGSAALQSESLISPTVAATSPGSPVVKFVTSPGGGVLSDDALHNFLACSSMVAGVPTSPVESTTTGLQRLPGGKLSIVTSPTSPNKAAAVTSPVVKFVTSPGGGVLSDYALHNFLAAATTPAAVTVTLPSPTSGEVSKAMAKVAAYKKAMAEVKAASAAAESEKNNKKKLSYSNIDIVTSSQPSDASFPVDVVQDEDEKVEETASTRSDKENQTDTTEVSSDIKTDTSSTKVAATLAVETSPQDDTAVVSTSILSPAKSSVLSPTAKKSVQEVDELLSKTRDWLVRHNESQKKKVPLSSSSSSEEQKVTGKTVLNAIENSETPPPSSNKKDEQKPNNVTGKSVLNAIDLLSPKGTNHNISKESPKTLDEMLQSKKNGTSSNTALLAMLSPKSASTGQATTTPPTKDDEGPKTSIMEQLEEIRIKQRELESRQQKANQEEQIETS